MGCNVQQALWILAVENGPGICACTSEVYWLLPIFSPCISGAAPFLTIWHTWIPNLLYTAWDMTWIYFLYIFFLPAWTFEDTFVRNLSLVVFRNKQIWPIWPLNNLYIWHIYSFKKSFILKCYTRTLEKAMAPHSSTLAWKIPWMEEPGRLQSMGSLRVRRDWATSLSLFTFIHWRRKWKPTPVFLPGESQGRGSLVGCHLWGRTEPDTTEAT